MGVGGEHVLVRLGPSFGRLPTTEVVVIYVYVVCMLCVCHFLAYV